VWVLAMTAAMTVWTVAYPAGDDGGVTVELFDRQLDAFRCYQRVTADGVFAVMERHENAVGR
jgi:hypothetical protein